MQVVSSLKTLRCALCKIVSRKGALYRICKDPNHKARHGQTKALKQRKRK